MPGERTHKISVSHGTAKRLRESHFTVPQMRSIQRRLDGCYLTLTARDIRHLIDWSLDIIEDRDPGR